MAVVELQDIAHAYSQSEDEWAVKPSLSHTWQDGGAYALLGPSGCGKTTLLNIMSGLLSPTRGRVLFDGKDAAGLPPEKRNIAQVFQFPVVYDTMTVRENLAFPLQNRGVAKEDIIRRTDEVAALLEVEDMLERRAGSLSPDAKQKVALGRGLARADIGAILFDEPLTVVDPGIKWRLRSNLKRLRRDADFTMIYVTHDQTEALTFADTIVVMHEGRIVQTGSPADLFACPRHTFVGYFIGSPGMNILPCRVSDGAAYLGPRRIAIHQTVNCANIAASVKTELGVRPEFVRFHEDGMPVNVRRVRDLGRRQIVDLDIDGVAVKMAAEELSEIPANPKVVFDPASTFLYLDGELAGSAT